MYFELLFALEEVKRTAPQHPEWKTTQPFKAVLENDHKALAARLDGMMKIFGATHTGMTTEAFDDYAKTWLSQARHPKTGKPYTEMIFQPMLEMLDYLRSEDFKTYIVSGGDTAFMRAFAEEVYGIPPEQVIGTTFVTVFQYKDGPGVDPAHQNWPITTTAQANRKASTPSSASGRFWRSATPTATCKCCSGPPPGRANASWAWCITPTPSASGPMTASRRSAVWTRPWTKPTNVAGRRRHGCRMASDLPVRCCHNRANAIDQPG
jgi:hypothetical protein